MHEHISVPKSFVYVYDMPSKFNTDILDLPTIWHPEQYDIDQVPDCECTPVSVTWQRCATRQRTNSCAHASGRCCSKTLCYAFIAWRRSQS